jgi:hypothetical protein
MASNAAFKVVKGPPAGIPPEAVNVTCDLAEKPIDINKKKTNAHLVDK